MTPRPKQIVLDKSAFIAFKGRRFNTLCDFVEHHCLLICEVLLYECVTSPVFKDGCLLSLCQELLQAGAYFCSRSEDMMRWEGQHARPYPRHLADIEKTKNLRTSPLKADHAFNEDEIAAKREVGYAFARTFLVDNVCRLGDLGRANQPEGLPDRMEWPPERSNRLAAFARSTDGVSFTNLALSLAPGDWVKDRERFCLTGEWMTWQYFRLVDVVLREYHYLWQIGGSPGKERAEHDYQDLGYISLLSRADAIIARDKGMIELARAAFPEKDVFLSLEEVPDSYRCDWTGG